MKSRADRPTLVVAVFGIFLLFGSLDVLGQQPRTITVFGVGTASAPPNYAVIKGTFHGEGDTAEEAFKAFRELKIKIEKSLAKELPDLTVSYLGEKPVLSEAAAGLAAMMAADVAGGAAPAESKKYKVSESIELRVNFETDMQRRQLAASLPKVIDTSSKLEISFEQGSNPWAAMMGAMGMGGLTSSSTEFALDDPEPARAKAFAGAMKEARTRASTLAGLAGGKLGQVISIEEVEEKETPPISITSVSFAADAGNNALRRHPYSSDQNQPIQIRQKLRVVFALESKPMLLDNRR